VSASARAQRVHPSNFPPLQGLPGALRAMSQGSIKQRNRLDWACFQARWLLIYSALIIYVSK